MSIVETAKSIATTIAGAFSPRDREHDRAVEALQTLEAHYAREATSEQEGLEAKRLAYETWRAPEREWREAQAAVASQSWTRHHDRGLAERAVRATVTSALEAFRDELDVLMERMLATKPPLPETRVNVLTDRVVTENADAIDRHIAAIHGVLVDGRRQPTALTRAREAAIHALPLLSVAEQARAIAEWRRQIQEQFQDVTLLTAREARTRVHESL